MAEQITSPVTRHLLPVRYLCRCLVSGVWCLLLCSCTKPVYKNTYVIAGTHVEVTSPSKEAGPIVYEEFRALEQVFNAFDPGSELSRLNASYAQALPVSSELFEVLALSRRIFEESDGAFDVSCGKLFHLWKTLIRTDNLSRMPDNKEILDARQYCGMRHVDFGAAQRTVTVTKPGLRIDLGAVAKGYMVDRAIVRLKERGITKALVNAGGDIYCLGSGWRIGIRDPHRTGAILKKVTLASQAIATSGNYEQSFEYEGKRFSHLIDPRSGRPVVNGIASVSVITRTCAEADAWATAFFVMGLEETQAFVSEHPGVAEVVIVMEDGQTHEFQ